MPRRNEVLARESIDTKIWIIDIVVAFPSRNEVLARESIDTFHVCHIKASHFDSGRNEVLARESIDTFSRINTVEFNQIK